MISESWSDDERPEDGVSTRRTFLRNFIAGFRNLFRVSLLCRCPLKSEEVEEVEEEMCFIEQLPNEVMEIIFAHIPQYLHLQLRVVCWRWCDILSRADQTLCFKGTVPHNELEKCTFRSIIGLTFCNLDINEMPRSVWEKIGFRVHSVVLDSCRLENYQSLKNLIDHCHNLQSLQVVLKENVKDAEEFCSPNMLKELNIIQRNLETFKISNRQQKTIDGIGKIHIIAFRFRRNIRGPFYRSPYWWPKNVMDKTYRLDEFLKELCNNSTLDCHCRPTLRDTSMQRFIELLIRFNKVVTNETILEHT